MNRYIDRNNSDIQTTKKTTKDRHMMSLLELSLLELSLFVSALLVLKINFVTRTQ